MPDNKKHHYVPQMYLRNFSNDGKTLRLYNLKAKRFIEGAAIDKQCYEDYFYGKELGLENALKDLEGKTATIFRNAIENNVIPDRHSGDHFILMEFIAAQLGRTTAAENEFNAAADHFSKTMIKHEAPELVPLLDKFSIHLKSAVLETLKTTICSSPVLIDLDFKLLVSHKNGQFIASDNPLVLFNQCFSVDTPLTHGMASKGLAIYLPISPQKAFLFYDSSLYETKRSRGQIVEIFLLDVLKLNALQFFNCNENLYFRNDQSVNDIEKIVSEYASLRHQDRISVKHENVTDTLGRKAELMTTSYLREFNPQLRFISIDENLKNKIKPGMRSPAWVNIVKDFVSALESETIELKDFPDFVFNHPLKPFVDFLF